MRRLAKEAIVTLAANLACAVINVALFGWISFKVGNMSNGGDTVMRFLLYSGAGIVAGISISVSFLLVFILVHRQRK